MALPVFTALQVLTADNLNDLVSFLPTTVRVASDQNLTTSSTTLQNVTALVLPLTANRTFEGLVIVSATLSAGTTEDIKLAFTFPTGCTLDEFHAGADVSATSSVSTGIWISTLGSTSSPSTARAFGLATSNNLSIFKHFRISVSSTAGNLQLQAAQNTSGANTTTIKAGSKMTMWRID